MLSCILKATQFFQEGGLCSLKIYLTRDGADADYYVIPVVLLAEGVGRIPRAMAAVVAQEFQENLPASRRWLIITTGVKTLGPRALMYSCLSNTDLGHEERPFYQETVCLYRHLVDMGIDMRRMVIEDQSDNTMQQAEYASKLLHNPTVVCRLEDAPASGIPVRLVCHDLHLNRARDLFSQHDLMVAGAWTVPYHGDYNGLPWNMKLPRPAFWAVEQVQAARNKRGKF